MRLAWLLLAAQLLGSAQTLPARIDSLLDAQAPARAGFWGISVVNLQSGKSLVARQADRFFVPASTAKLFSAALAIDRLGPLHRFVTVAAADRAPDSSGRLAGDLVLVGGGDPAMSARAYPYTGKEAGGNALAAIEDLADQVVARGVKRIEGDIVGDDTAYPWEPYAEGVAQEDALWPYGAPSSALSVNENRIAITLRPGQRVGDPARIRVSPPLEYFVIDNRVRTSAGGEARIEVERMQGSRQVRLWGVLPLKSRRGRVLALHDPAEYAAAALFEALTRRGVAITGRPVAKHRFANEVEAMKNGTKAGAAPSVELARRLSPPLAEILEVMTKESLNLHAELVLREVGRVRRKAGTRQAGLAELLSFVREAGIQEGDCALVDGSGLSMSNMVTPQALTKLLAHMYASPLRDTWLRLLAAGGEDGTLQKRFTKRRPQASEPRPVR